MQTHQSSQSLQESLMKAGYTQTHCVCVFFVTLTLGYGCTTPNSQRSSNIFHVIEDTMRPLCPVWESERETVMSLSEGFPPAVAVCLSAPVSPSGCFGRGKEGRRENDEHTSCVSEGVCVCVCVLSLKGEKKGGLVTVQIQINQSQWEDEAGRREREMPKKERETNRKKPKKQMKIEEGKQDIQVFKTESLIWTLTDFNFRLL